MKKQILVLALAMSASLSYAQVLKNNMMEGYKPGDKLEKAVYTDKTDPIRQDTWCRAFTTAPMAGYEGPLVGEELTYPGYAEGGASICFGNFPEGVKGAPSTVYSIDAGKKYSKGTLYLSFLVNFSKLGSAGMADFLALSASFVGGGNRGLVYAAREGNSGIRFGVGLIKPRIEGTMAYEYNKTHLLVLKLDYAQNEASLFVNPDLSGEEPKADMVINGGDNILKHAIRSVSFRNRGGNVGSLGNFRLSNAWAGVTVH